MKTRMAWTVKARTEESQAEVLLYDAIGEWAGKSAKDFVKEIKALGDVSSITLRINSAGGDVFDAQAMYSCLRSHKARKTVRIDGLAASAASVVAMVGDEIIMPENALMMIHNPWTCACGEAEDLRKSAEVLDKVRYTLATVYMVKTGLDYDKIKSMMDEETWMSAEEAKELGFCDTISGAIEIAASARSLSEGDVRWRTAAGEAVFSRELAAKMPEAAQKVPLVLLKQGTRPAEPPQITVKIKEESTLDIKTVADLEAAYPELVAGIRATASIDGVAAERERLKALDSLAGPGRDAIITKAKYEEPKDARDVALELLKASQNAAALQDRREDASVVNVALQSLNINPTVKEREEEVQAKIASAINSMRGYKA